MNFFTLTADGTFLIGRSPRNTQVTVLLSGGFGGGTVTYGTMTAAGAFVAFTAPAPQAVFGNVTMFLGRGQKLALQISGSTTPTLSVGIAGDYFEVDSSMHKHR